jgi:hypothetical protein
MHDRRPEPYRAPTDRALSGTRMTRRSSSGSTWNWPGSGRSGRWLATLLLGIETPQVIPAHIMGSPARRLLNPITRCRDYPHNRYAGTDDGRGTGAKLDTNRLTLMCGQAGAPFVRQAETCSPCTHHRADRQACGILLDARVADLARSKLPRGGSANDRACRPGLPLKARPCRGRLSGRWGR